MNDHVMIKLRVSGYFQSVYHILLAGGRKFILKKTSARTYIYGMDEMPFMVYPVEFCISKNLKTQ